MPHASATTSGGGGGGDTNNIVNESLAIAKKLFNACLLVWGDLDPYWIRVSEESDDLDFDLDLDPNWDALYVDVDLDSTWTRMWIRTI